MKSIFSVFLLLFSVTGFCQSTGRPELTGTNSTVAIQKPAILSNRYYQQLANNPSDAGAWLNYYNWISHTKELTASEKQQQLSQAIQSSRQYIASSWQFSLMNFIQSRKRNKTYLDAAISHSDDKSAVYPYAIQFAIITQNQALLNEYARALNELAPLSPVLYEYHYNALMSASGNAVIYAKGLSDLAPMAVLQQVYGVRKDIRFRYYEQTITDTANAYICLSAGKEIIGAYPNAAYTGLLVRIAGNGTPGEPESKAGLFKLTQLKSVQSLSEDEKLILRNYLPSFVLLYKSYKTNHSPVAEEWKQLAQTTGRLTGNLENVHKMIGE